MNLLKVLFAITSGLTTLLVKHLAIVAKKVKIPKLINTISCITFHKSDFSQKKLRNQRYSALLIFVVKYIIVESDGPPVEIIKI